MAVEILFCEVILPEFVQTVTWSTTERREIRSFPYPSVFELTGRQRLTVKRGIDKEGGIETYSSPNESPDRVREEERD